MNNLIAKKILVVDDDVDLLMLLERLLNKEGFTVETATTLAEAEDINAYFDPHLVLLDINVKGQDGRKLCWQFKNSGTGVKVIIMSGYDFSVGRAVLFGADDLVPKPFNTEYLRHRIDSLLINTEVST